MSGPYAAAAWAYRHAGWAGVLPLPAGAKWPPPGGYTGWAGVDPSGADVQAWIDGREGAGNVALRLPSGVYGLDVDNYAGKAGGATLAELERLHGPLPRTWVVSSRDDGVSGIRLFRAVLPVGRRWLDKPGPGIEAIHLGHRYAVVWPSLHPDTGRKYVWTGRDGCTYDGPVPEVRHLAELPDAWIEALSEPGEVRVGEMAGHAETVDTVSGWRQGDEPCPRVSDAHARALRGLREALDGAALHPVSTAGIHELVNLGHEGHVGVRRALAEHYAAHVEVRAGRGEDRGAAEAEWWRAVRGAIGKLPGAPRETCDCGLWAGEGLTFTPLELGVTFTAPGAEFEFLKIDLTNPGGDAFDEPAPIEGEVIDAVPAGGAAQAAPLDLAGVLISRMLTAGQLRDRPAPPWLVEGLLTLDSASWLIAAPGSYKSFVALDWAGHVAAGRDWMGRGVRPGGVVYVVAEGAAGMGPRIRAWEQRNGPMGPGVMFLPMPVQIGRPDHWAALVEACRRLGPALVILDTQARITVGIDENDNSAMGEVVEAIEALRGATGACVLVVHHTGRSGRHARGASAIDGAQDTELRLDRTADRRIVLKIDKSKNAADDVRVELELFVTELDNGGSSLVVGAPLTAVSSKPWEQDPADRKARILGVLHEQFSEQGGSAAQVLAVLREKGWTDDYPKTTFYRWWNDLQRTDKIEQVHGTQRWVLAESSATSERSDSHAVS